MQPQAVRRHRPAPPALGHRAHERKTASKLSCVRLPNDPVEMAIGDGQGGRRPRGGHRSHLWVVLAGRPAPRARGQRPPGPPFGAQVGGPAGKERRDRRHRPGRAALRMHRLPEAWIAPPEARELRELVRYRAKLVALRIRPESPGARRHGQTRRPAASWTTCSARAASACLDAMPFDRAYASGSSRSGAGRRLRQRGRPCSNGRSDKSLEGRQGLPGCPGHRRRGQDHGGHLRGRDRRRQPLLLARQAGLLGRAHPPPRRVRHQGPPLRHHQARAPSSCAGRPSKPSPATTAGHP